MCILKTELWNIYSICPSFYSLVSFITCFSYSAGKFITCLMFYAWNACHLWVKFSIVFSVGLWFICYAYLPFNAHDLVFTLVLWMFSLLSSKCPTKNHENPKNLILLYCDYWDCVGLFSCSLGTISSTNIFGAIAGEWSWKPIFPWDTYHFTSFKRWT